MFSRNHFWERSFSSPLALFTGTYVPSGWSTLAFTLSARCVLSMYSLMAIIMSRSLTGNSVSTLARRFLGIMSEDPMYISGDPPFSK